MDRRFGGELGSLGREKDLSREVRTTPSEKSYTELVLPFLLSLERCRGFSGYRIQCGPEEGMTNRRKDKRVECESLNPCPPPIHVPSAATLYRSGPTLVSRGRRTTRCGLPLRVVQPFFLPLGPQTYHQSFPADGKSEETLEPLILI